MSFAARPRSGLPRDRLVPILIGLAIGLGWGWAAAGAVAVPGATSLDGAIHAFIFAAFLGLASVVGMVAWLARRKTGGAVFLTVVCAAIGWPLAFNLGPKYVPPLDLVGTIELELTSPIVTHLTGEATCETEFAGDDGIRWVGSEDVGTVRGARVGVGIGFSGTASLHITGGDATIYYGNLTSWDPGADRASGAVSFVASQRADGFGGVGSGPATGTVTWECRAPSTSPPP